MQTKKERATNVITYGKVELTKTLIPSPYTPKNGGNFVDHGNILETLAIGIRDNLPVLLVGESGTGKTSAIRFLANQTDSGLRRVNLNGGTTADELVGRKMFNDKGTYWVDGILTEAMRNGEWIVLDEINAALPEVLFVLQSVMDDDGYLVLTEKDDKEIVIKHKDFRIFATCNPPEYAGTKEMNKALLSRFAICISAEFPNQKKELEIIEHHLGNAVATSEMAIKLVSLADETRKSKDLGNTEYAINTRDVINVLRLAENMSPLEAFALAFANKLDSSDKNSIKAMARLHLPENKKKAHQTRTPIQNTEDLKIGQNYVIDADMINIYFGMTTDRNEFSQLVKKDLGSVIGDAKGRSNCIKGDEFTLDAVYYEEDDSGANSMEKMGAGDKIASAITITAGPNRGNQAVILHSKKIDEILGSQTVDIVKSIYEIS